MHLPLRVKLAVTAVIWISIVPAAAAANVGGAFGDVLDAFTNHTLTDTIFVSARKLFWALAFMSLVWTMGLLIIRQDLGEVLMELLRFMVVTGIFYWLLINASTQFGGDGFVNTIVQSFFRMANDQASDDLLRTSGEHIFVKGLRIFYTVMGSTGDGDDADRLITAGIALGIMIICTTIAAQFLLALVMAWVLGYAGIFLLGFGGARWTSQIAINYYKHVLAVGITVLALAVIGAVGVSYLEALTFNPSRMGPEVEFPYLGLMLTASILILVLSIKIPQLLYTLVTGSTLGLYTGFASAAGTAIASAGSSAYAAATSRLPGGGGGGGTQAIGSGHAAHRAESVMDAVQRSSAVAGGMADPFHLNSGSDAFGVGRHADPMRGSAARSAFGTPRADTELSDAHGPATTQFSSIGSERAVDVRGESRDDRSSGPATADSSRRRQDTGGEEAAIVIASGDSPIDARDPIPDKRGQVLQADQIHAHHDRLLEPSEPSFTPESRQDRSLGITPSGTGSDMPGMSQGQALSPDMAHSDESRFANHVRNGKSASEALAESSGHYAIEATEPLSAKRQCEASLLSTASEGARAIAGETHVMHVPADPLPSHEGIQAVDVDDVAHGARLTPSVSPAEPPAHGGVKSSGHLPSDCLDAQAYAKGMTDGRTSSMDSVGPAEVQSENHSQARYYSAGRASDGTSACEATGSLFMETEREGVSLAPASTTVRAVADEVQVASAAHSGATPGDQLYAGGPEIAGAHVPVDHDGLEDDKPLRASTKGQDDSHRIPSDLSHIHAPGTVHAGTLESDIARSDVSSPVIFGNEPSSTEPAKAGDDVLQGTLPIVESPAAQDASVQAPSAVGAAERTDDAPSRHGLRAADAEDHTDSVRKRIDVRSTSPSPGSDGMPSGDPT